MEKIRILLADDHGVLRAGLTMLLDAQPDMQVVGEAADGEGAVRKALELHPDVVLMDIGMPGIGGLEATRRIKSEAPDVKVLILSMYDDPSYLHQALQVGASGYTLKKVADMDLLSAIRAVQAGEIFLHPSLTRVLVTQFYHGGAEARATGEGKPDALSERETEVLRLIARGHTNQEIADMLYLSVKTVETYKARLMEKLNLRGRAALVRYAMEKGLLASEPHPGEPDR